MKFMISPQIIYFATDNCVSTFTPVHLLLIYNIRTKTQWLKLVCA